MSTVGRVATQSGEGLVIPSEMNFSFYIKAKPVKHAEKAASHGIFIYDKNGKRYLKFSRWTNINQTCLSLQNRNHLVQLYSQMMFCSLYLLPTPERILIIGLGGGVLPMALSSVLPNAVIDVIEIDPAVVRIARKYFGFTPKANLNVYEEDGCEFVSRSAASGRSYDLVMIDAFATKGVPERLSSRHFLLQLKELLDDKGVLAVNLYSTQKSYDTIAALYQSIFGRHYMLAAPMGALAWVRLPNRRTRIILVKKDGLPSMELIRENSTLLAEKLLPLGVDPVRLLPMFTLQG